MIKELSKHQRVFLLLGLVLGIFSMALAKFDKTYRFIPLELFARLLFFIFLFIAYFSSFRKEEVREFAGRINPKLFLFVLLLAFVSRFIFLQQYPYASIGDELRDSGLNALRIYQGEIKNIFGYGSYDGYGLGIPFFSSLFYRIFGSSVLTFRVPAALISILDISLIYLLCVFLFHYKVAFWTTMIMVSSWWHLYLSRTELVVILDSFIASLILLVFFLLKRRKLLDFALFGTILGFSLGFHASTRVFLVLLPMVIFYLLFFKKEGLKWRFGKILLVLLYFFVGVGPRLWYGNLDAVSQRNKSFYYKNEDVSLNELSTRYKKSLMVWFYEPLQSRFPGEKPILSPILFFFFLTGFFALLFIIFKKKNYSLFVLYLFIFLIPFSNSALTDTLNFGQRLIPLLPIGSVFGGFGINFLLSKIKQKIIYLAASSMIFIYLFFSVVSFFYKRQANYNHDVSDFLSMHIIYFLKKNGASSDKTICLRLSPENSSNFDLMHYKEQYEYFFPGIKFEMSPNDLMKNSEVYIYSGSCQRNSLSSNLQDQAVLGRKLFRVDCSKNNSFVCPLANNSDFSIYY